MTDLHDFEARIRHTIGRAAETFTPPRDAMERAIDTARARREASPTSQSSTARWVLPLAAAAAVLIIASVVTVLVNTSRHAGPAGPRVSPVPSVSTSPLTPTRPASSSPTSPVASATQRITLGTAALEIPYDWVARAQPPATSDNWPTWCLEPSTAPPSATTCLVMFREVPATWTGQALDPNIEGGWSSNPAYCGTGGSLRRDLLAYDDRLFGSRQADYRRWHYDCTNGTAYDIEQYVVATGPGYILFSDHAGTQVHDAMTTIAKTARVPEQTTPLRYADTGIVRTVVHEADGYHITLDRVVTSGDTPINNNPTTYPYVISDSVAAQSRLAPAVGALLFVATDGYHVRQTYRY